MMKFFMYVSFMFFFIFKNKFWVFQFFMFLGSFLFLFLGSYTNNWFQLSNNLGCDLLSFGLIILSFWIIALMFTSSFLVYDQNDFLSLFMLMIFFLTLFLYLTFSVTSLLMFYLFFECSLIPILIMIMGWGLQLDRIQAGLYLLFYTLFASLPLLLSIIFFFLKYKTLCFLIFCEVNYYLVNNWYVYISMILAFLVKMPMFLVHLWLPKAHVEAPISGSMILAGVMLKLGGYGLLRIYLILSNLNFFIINYLLISVSLIGGLMMSLVCVFQVDLKALIAYSSVVHMSILLGGFMTMFSWSMYGSFLMMISHGLCSSGLFCLVNIVYERLGSRSILINKGLINFMPSMSLWWFLLCSSNMAAPPSLNLLSEIILINSMISWSNFILLILLFLSFFSAVYTLYLYSYTQHGKLISLYSFTQGYLREFLMLILHWIPLNFLILKSELFCLWI
uniref:NADH-ubiquinone oxidoreductase chain 4 n=1 Tax=Sinopoppia nigroflagella TaxID=2803872 RepID=A0A897G6U5_9HYME|nr:NADH dehydrogenase subunit 4 [Sinopoppia nigroflagella]QSF20072.1 NADH dehydrogenase subunit 4 [Sinopoppia nigroflagella]